MSSNKRNQNSDLSEEEILLLIEKRSLAKKSKDWKSADLFRKELSDSGIELFDRPDGTTHWKYQK